MNDLFDQVDIWSRNPWFIATVDAAASVFWGVLTYYVNRRGVLNFGKGLPKLRRDENPKVFERWIGAGIAVTLFVALTAVGKVIASVIGA